MRGAPRYTAGIDDARTMGATRAPHRRSTRHSARAASRLLNRPGSGGETIQFFVLSWKDLVAECERRDSGLFDVAPGVAMFSDLIERDSAAPSTTNDISQLRAS